MSIANMLFSVFYKLMYFRENLKAELSYSGLLVKELAGRAGLKKHTIDNYLSTRGRMPAADVAVKIARVLGVSVEYLVTGAEAENNQLGGFSPEVRLMARIAEGLQPEYRKIALSLVEALRKFNHAD
jgi:transcriptional regulator with XRE-family HTH domain